MSFIGIVPLTDIRAAGAVKCGATLYFRGMGREWRILNAEERRVHIDVEGRHGFTPDRYGVHEDWRNEVAF